MQPQNLSKIRISEWSFNELREECIDKLILLDPKVEITEESLSLLPADIREFFYLLLQSSD